MEYFEYTSWTKNILLRKNDLIIFSRVSQIRCTKLKSCNFVGNGRNCIRFFASDAVRTVIYLEAKKSN